MSLPFSYTAICDLHTVSSPKPWSHRGKLRLNEATLTAAASSEELRLVESSEQRRLHWPRMKISPLELFRKGHLSLLRISALMKHDPLTFLTTQAFGFRCFLYSLRHIPTELIIYVYIIAAGTTRSMGSEHRYKYIRPVASSRHSPGLQNGHLADLLKDCQARSVPFHASLP